MKNQSGSTLIISLIFLAALTVGVMYSLEGSNIQSKMVANSIFATLTYQECRNEHQSQLTRFNTDDNTDFASLLSLAGVPNDELETAEYKEILAALNTTKTNIDNETPPKSDLQVTWKYMQDAPAGRGGFDLDTESQTKSYLYESDCIADFNSSLSNHTLGVIVNGLKQSGIMN